jgi:transposase
MWTTQNRKRYDRSRLRYPSDLTDDEWAHVAPLISPAKRGGNKRTVVVREVMNGIMYILSTGCQWRALPKDLPPRSTVHDYLDLWSYDGTLDRIHHALYVECRQQSERDPSPTAAIIDSQSVKAPKKMLWGERRGQWHHRRSSESTERPMPQLNDLSRSLVVLEQDATLIAVIEMGQSSWLVAGIVPGVERSPLKKLAVDESALLKLLNRWREEAEKAGHKIVRIAIAFEAGRDGFWLAGALAPGSRYRSPCHSRIQRSGLARAPARQNRPA